LGKHQFIPIFNSRSLAVWNKQAGNGMMFLVKTPYGQNRMFGAIGIEFMEWGDGNVEMQVVAIPTKPCLEKNGMHKLNEHLREKLQPDAGNHDLESKDTYASWHPFYHEPVNGERSVVLKCRLKNFQAEEENILYAMGIIAGIQKNIIDVPIHIINDYKEKTLSHLGHRVEEDIRVYNVMLRDPSSGQSLM